MTGRRNWLLQQMGISQYRLRHQGVMRGEIAIDLSAAIRLLVISAESVSSAHWLIKDILHLLTLRDSQLMILRPEQLTMLPESLNCMVWFLGIEPDKRYASIQLETPSLNELSVSEVKRTLWHQMCHYDSDLFSSS